jgi:hypothetical protein
VNVPYHHKEKAPSCLTTGKHASTTEGTLKGVRPVWGRLSRNPHLKEGKARLFQSIPTKAFGRG